MSVERSGIETLTKLPVNQVFTGKPDKKSRSKAETDGNRRSRSVEHKGDEGTSAQRILSVPGSFGLGNI